MKGFDLGDLVASVGVLGSYAEYALVPAAQLVKVPGKLSPEHGLLMSGMTAHYGLRNIPAEGGQHGADSRGSRRRGALLTQMAKRLGSARNCDGLNFGEGGAIARGGCLRCDSLHRTGFCEGGQGLTDDKGVDVVYDSVGKTTFEGVQSREAARDCWRCSEASSGPVPPFDLIQLSSKGSLFITRPPCGTTLLHEKSLSAARATCWVGLQAES